MARNDDPNPWLQLAGRRPQAAKRPRGTRAPAPLPRAATTPYGRFLDLCCEHDILGGRASPKAVAEMQRVFLAALKADEPLPTEMQAFLAYSFAQLCKHAPSPLLTNTAHHTNANDPIFDLLEANAAAYLHAARAGLIDDKRPSATVEECYGVSNKTVRRWRDKFPQPNVAEPGQHCEDPTTISRRMYTSGARYQLEKLHETMNTTRRRLDRRKKLGGARTAGK